MKIVFFAYSAGIGLTYHLTELALAYQKRGVDILLIHNGIEQNKGLFERLNNHNVEQFNIEKFSLADFFLKNRKEYQGCVIHCQGIKQVEMVRKEKESLNSKILLTVHAYRNGKWYKNIYALALYTKYKMLIDYWHFCSISARDDFFKYIPFNNSDNTVIAPLGVDFTGLEGESSDMVERVNNIITNKTHTFSCDNKYIFYLAQFHPHKRHDQILRLFADTFKNKKNTYLVLMGDGSKLLCASKQANYLNIADNVIFTGRVDRGVIGAYLKNADAALVMSKNETFGHNIIEPLALGIPVFTTNVGIAQQVISQYYDGVVGDGPIIFKAMETFLSGEITLKPTLSKRYNWDEVALQYFNIYKKINAE
ncbi:glycosyltransferase [Psychromonas arctica]|uniref:glycosyltransferase n=1 Tax=Psychromonas arctica TaxID=168275 RepID=UPI000409C3D7|nr:glycosyltransferase [Psychromonas arctica]